MGNNAYHEKLVSDTLMNESPTEAMKKIGTTAFRHIENLIALGVMRLSIRSRFLLA